MRSAGLALARPVKQPPRAGGCQPGLQRTGQGGQGTARLIQLPAAAGASSADADPLPPSPAPAPPPPGLVPLFDPPRHDTKETIERCQAMGINVKMVTGDQLLIGKETAKQLGMGNNMFTTEALLKAKQSFGLVEGHASVEELVEHADGFAEVFPEHKFMIVKILQVGAQIFIPLAGGSP